MPTFDPVFPLLLRLISGAIKYCPFLSMVHTAIDTAKRNLLRSLLWAHFRERVCRARHPSVLVLLARVPLDQVVQFQAQQRYAFTLGFALKQQFGAVKTAVFAQQNMLISGHQQRELAVHALDE